MWHYAGHHRELVSQLGGENTGIWTEPGHFGTFPEGNSGEESQEHIGRGIRIVSGRMGVEFESMANTEVRKNTRLSSRAVHRAARILLWMKGFASFSAWVLLS